MIVMKFGGSSLADAGQIHKALEIVRGRLARSPVVVCSAHKGMTDMLLDAARRAAKGEADPQAIVTRQRKVFEDLGGDPRMLDPFFQEIEDLLRGISLVREASLRSLDYAASFGERMSCRAIAEGFRRRGLKAEAFDAFDLGFITDANFGGARPIKDYERLMAKAFAEKVDKGVVPIVTGFIGKSEDGDITTVGRNGSDYSATVIAAGIDADECEIWTDTDGVMTADPNLIPSARSIPTMSFAEASELAYYGGRVLHPSTLLPAIKKNIPVRVLNTNRPDHPGTVITEGGGEAEGPVTSIAYKRHQSVVTVESTKMLGQPGFLAKIFEVFGRNRIDIDMISTSEITVSMTCDAKVRLEGTLSELSDHGRARLDREKTLICIVGKNIKQQRGVRAQIFGALAAAEVNVEMISQGANNINISLLIDDKDVPRGVSALHKALFET